jgi:CheY-like chemotaxis protein
LSETLHPQAHYPPPRVLLVETEPSAREAAAGVLGSAGLEVIAEATDSAAALRIVEATAGPPPAVLVTDTELPAGSLDGLALAAAARRRWPGLGVVYITGRPSGLDGHVLGARDRFLPRPVAPASLVRAVGGLMFAPRRAA